MPRALALCILALLLASCALSAPEIPAATPVPTLNPTCTPVPALTLTPTPTVTANPSPIPQQTEPAVQTVSSPGNGAKIIFHNGQILTMVRDQPNAEAIFIRGDRIQAVGSDNDILALRGADTQVMDLSGLTLMPGFVDAHAHIAPEKEDPNEFKARQDEAIRSGITTETEMFVTPDVLDQLKAYDQAGLMHLRWNTYLLYNTNCGERFDADWYKTYKQGEDITSHIRNQGVKLFADGGSCHVPAVSFEYPGGYGKGDLFMTQDQLTAVVKEVQDSGHQVAIHALGDRAIQEAQDAIAAALNGAPNSYRHRIEHNAVLHDALLPRYNQIGILPVIFGSYATCWRVNSGSQFKYLVPVSLGTWEWPWRALLDANPGVKAAWHSDYPVFPNIHPMAHLYGFVTRNQVADDGSICRAPDWLKRGAITVGEALPIMTINSAYALFREKEIGSLEAGKFADAVILSANPLTIQPDAIKDINVLMTMIGGKVEYCAAGYYAFCPTASPSAPIPTSKTRTAFPSVTASSSLPDSPPSNAVDGNLDTTWSAGTHPVQWIQVDLGEPKSVISIRLVIAQYPAGETVHQIWGGTDASKLALLHEFKGYTEDAGELEFKPSRSLSSLRYIKIVTTQSPSWVAWREVEIISP